MIDSDLTVSNQDASGSSVYVSSPSMSDNTSRMSRIPETFLHALRIIDDKRLSDLRIVSKKKSKLETVIFIAILRQYFGFTEYTAGRLF